MRKNRSTMVWTGPICKSCGEKHLPFEIKTLNIEEDFEGRDVVTFECPETKEVTKSFIYGE